MSIVTAVCQHCGNQFSRPFHSKKPAKYCSQKCVHESQRKINSICLHCGKEFKALGTKIKHCSNYCARQSTRKYDDATCAYCGIIFAPRKSKSFNFCSEKCYYASFVKMRKCFYCGKEFRAHKAKSYCSKKCAYESKKNPDAYATRECINCGKNFIISKAQIRLRNGGKYCSNKCRVEYCVGERHPVWKENKVIYDPGPNWYIQRKIALKRDSYHCQLCGNGREHKVKIDVHHIIKCRLFNGDYERANDLSNLVTLCRKCHLKVEFGKLPCPLP